MSAQDAPGRAAAVAPGSAPEAPPNAPQRAAQGPSRHEVLPPGAPPPRPFTDAETKAIDTAVRVGAGFEKFWDEVAHAWGVLRYRARNRYMHRLRFLRDRGEVIPALPRGGRPGRARSPENRIRPLTAAALIDLASDGWRVAIAAKDAEAAQLRREVDAWRDEISAAAARLRDAERDRDAAIGTCAQLRPRLGEVLRRCATPALLPDAFERVDPVAVRQGDRVSVEARWPSGDVVGVIPGVSTVIIVLRNADGTEARMPVNPAARLWRLLPY